MHQNSIFNDYALMKAPRDLIFGIYTKMTARNDIRYINLHYLVIKGHKRSFSKKKIKIIIDIK